MLNYLVIEGFKEAAEEFLKESGLGEFSRSSSTSCASDESVCDSETSTIVEIEGIENRLKVRKAIQSGHISEAIREINNLDPEILDNTPTVYFHLKLEEFLEKIKELRQLRVQLNCGVDSNTNNNTNNNTGNDEETEDVVMMKIIDIIEFARENLAPIAQEQAGGVYLSELEDAMSLLAAEIGAKWPTDELLQPEHRIKVAKEVNSAILSNQSQPEYSKLPEILDLMNWAQEKLSERAIFPKLIDPVSGKYED